MRSDALRSFFAKTLEPFPYPVKITDWNGNSFSCGQDQSHWCGQPLSLKFRTPAAAKKALHLDAMGVLESFLRKDVEIEGNLYALPLLKRHVNVSKVSFLCSLPWLAKSFAFQSLNRAKANVQSHYDIPQSALDLYLDKVYRSYSCGMFDAPEHRTIPELIKVGAGQQDNFDSLEQSMWRKFKDAADFVQPAPGETLLDVGCGYGGQLAVALDNHPFGKVVGWTHSQNQVNAGCALLEKHDRSRYEMNLGDYRQEERVFDHITSTGMVCHVGPRGLVPYLKKVRKLIKTGGRYMHHVIMSVPSTVPFDLQTGPAFNKRYVWPGFHWFTFGTHVRALETHGFQVSLVKNLSQHYAKTTAAWYERMMGQSDKMIEYAGDPTFRAWRIFLAGISGGFAAKEITVYRIYCEAV